jgi:predicted nucleic acid-binding protein
MQEGIVVSIANATIAAVAIAHDLSLLTDNVKDFPMNDLTLYPLPSV